MKKAVVANNAYTMEDPNDILKDIEQRLNKIAEWIELVVTFFMHKGWFFDFELPITSYFIQIAIEEPIIFEGCLKSYFSERVDFIDELVKVRFPHRSVIISKALKSHRNTDYELSIPIILCQVDGIFREYTDKEFFSSKNKKAEKVFDKYKIENKNQKSYLAALAPLREYNLLSASFNESKKYPNIVSRNAILHGYDVNYATEINSLKVISQLNYVARVVFDILTGNDDWIKQAMKNDK